MAIKISQAFKPKQNLPTAPLIKYVKKAKSWCKTEFNEAGKQIQTWSENKEDLE